MQTDNGSDTKDARDLDRGVSSIAPAPSNIPEQEQTNEEREVDVESMLPASHQTEEMMNMQKKTQTETAGRAHIRRIVKEYADKQKYGAPILPSAVPTEDEKAIAEMERVLRGKSKRAAAKAKEAEDHVLIKITCANRLVHKFSITASLRKMDLYDNEMRMELACSAQDAGDFCSKYLKAKHLADAHVTNLQIVGLQFVSLGKRDSEYHSLPSLSMIKSLRKRHRHYEVLNVTYERQVGAQHKLFLRTSLL